MGKVAINKAKWDIGGVGDVGDVRINEINWIKVNGVVRGFLEDFFKGFKEFKNRGVWLDYDPHRIRQNPRC